MHIAYLEVAQHQIDIERPVGRFCSLAMQPMLNNLPNRSRPGVYGLTIFQIGSLLLGVDLLESKAAVKADF